MNHLTKREIEDAIFQGICPTRTFLISPLRCVFIIANDLVTPPATVFEWLYFFKSTLYIEGIPDSRVFLRELPILIFHKFVEEYVKFYREWAKAIFEYMPVITADVQSRMKWQVCRATSIDKVILVRNQLSMAQYYWATFNVVGDTSERATLISSLFDALKPWLDKDLWKAIEEGKDDSSGKRVNKLYDQQIEIFDNENVDEPIDEIIMS